MAARRNSAEPIPKDADPYPGERVRDAHGEFRCLAYAEGYVMCRRPRCVVLVKDRAEWLALRAASREG